MRLDNLITEALRENAISLQFLQENIVHASEQKKNRQTKLAFVTKDITPTQILHNSGPVGIVLWIPREVYFRLTQQEDK